VPAVTVMGGALERLPVLAVVVAIACHAYLNG
jgi:hypothetical protein